MTQKLQIKETLPVLAFNFDQLKAWATSLTERYADMVVTEDAIADVKRDMAELNKAKKAVDDARKEAVRRVSEPIRAFETQIKEVCNIFDAAYAGLSGQVKAFEEAQRNEKRKVVEGIIRESLLDAFDDAEHMRIPVQEKWLNKATSLKSIREDVAAIIDREIQERELRRQAEQARIDRTAAIESEVNRLNAETGLSLPVAQFLGGRWADAPLADALTHVREEFRLRHEVMQRTKLVPPAPVAAHKTPANSVAAHKTPDDEPQTGSALTGRTKACSVVFSYDVALEDEIQAALENIRSLSVNFAFRSK